MNFATRSFKLIPLADFQLVLCERRTKNVIADLSILGEFKQMKNSNSFTEFKTKFTTQSNEENGVDAPVCF